MKTLYSFLACALLIAPSVSAQQWNTLGYGLDKVVRTIVKHNNDIYVGGAFSNAGGNPDADYLARWDGNTWHAVAPGLNGTVWAIDFWGENIYVGGEFTIAGNNPNTRHIAMWNGSSWFALGPGLNKTVLTIKVYPFDPIDGVIYAGGDFEVEGSDGHFAMWGLNGQNWETLDSGVNDKVYSIAIYDDYLYIGGDFTNAGGNADADYLTKWDGKVWTSVGNGLQGSVYMLNVHDSLLYAGGSFTGNVAKWDGGDWTNYGLNSTWGEIGGVGINGTDIIATAWDEGVYRWDGQEWTFLYESGNILPEDFGAILVDGEDVYIGGEFKLYGPNTNNIARWGEPVITSTEESKKQNSNSLQLFPNPACNAIQILSDGFQSGIFTLTIMDTSGKVILKKQTEDRKLDISSLKPAVYYLQVQNEKKTSVGKLIKL